MAKNKQKSALKADYSAIKSMNKKPKAISS
jgi:hypothetical protein